jgi:pyridoxamine 5'-phosphate oxidase
MPAFAGMTVARCQRTKLAGKAVRPLESRPRNRERGGRQLDDIEKGDERMANDPIRKFQRWLAEARQAGVPLPEAMALATADQRGRPSVRYVLLKGADARGFVFYTNRLSAKARDLRANRRAALAFYWDAPGRQVRCEGRVTEVAAAEADAYWASRPRGSQVASAASRQSAPLDSSGSLMARYRELLREYEGKEVPRPEVWSGFRLGPERIEFWTRREPRLHKRELFVKSRGRWTMKLLQP